MGELKMTAGKIFAGSYAIFSGLLIVIATGFVLAPIFHRVLHHFHVESTINPVMLCEWLRRRKPPVGGQASVAHWLRLK
jgi:hypothetical protein